MPPNIEPALARRLEALTGADAQCCVDGYQEHVEDALASPAFATALARAKAMSDEKRLLVLALLKRQGEMCACEIQAALELTHATVSHHMGTLLGAGLVTSDKRGKWTHYQLTPAIRDIVP